MKKTILSSVMLMAAFFAAGTMFNEAAAASCPIKSDCAAKQKVKPAPAEKCSKPMTPEEHAKIREAKKAEFEARLKLTEQQKAQIEKIKTDEKNALKSCRKNIQKEQEKLEKLIEQEKSVRAQSIKKFEALLTETQKEELKKLHEEIKEERAKFAPHEDCGCECPCHKGHAPMKHDRPSKHHRSHNCMHPQGSAPDCSEPTSK